MALDPARAATYRKQLLIGAGVREPVAYPRSIKPLIRFAHSFILTDNAVTPADLTVDWLDGNVVQAAGSSVDFTGTTALTPVDDPKAVLIVERFSICIMPGPTEADPLKFPVFLENGTVTHQPAGGADLRVATFAEHMGEVFNQRMVAVGPLYAQTFVQEVDTKPLRRGPFWVNLESDTWVAKPLSAVDTGGNVSCLIVGDGHVFNNAGWTPDDAGTSCNADSYVQGLLRNFAAAKSKLAGLFGKSIPSIAPMK